MKRHSKVLGHPLSDKPTIRNIQENIMKAKAGKIRGVQLRLEEKTLI